MTTVRILFVCLGNICRSPTAEAVMRALVKEAGLVGEVDLDSAGTGGWHVGEAPDQRATAEAARRGIRMMGRARQVRAADFADFDLIVAMDAANERELRQAAPDEASRGKIVLLRSFDPAAVSAADLDVPDPYYGGPHGFADVFELVDRACRGLLDDVRRRLADVA